MPEQMNDAHAKHQNLDEDKNYAGVTKCSMSTDLQLKQEELPKGEI